MKNSDIQIEVLKSKLQQVVVTESNVSYKGSITLDEDLMDEADMYEWELVHVNNKKRGTRIITYIPRGERGSGCVCMNEGASHFAEEGDEIHVLSFCHIPKSQASTHQPLIIHTDENNRVLRANVMAES
jgi:aspartate 1-decarboxylase